MADHSKWKPLQELPYVPSINKDIIPSLKVHPLPRFKSMKPGHRHKCHSKAQEAIMVLNTKLFKYLQEVIMVLTTKLFKYLPTRDLLDCYHVQSFSLQGITKLYICWHMHTTHAFLWLIPPYLALQSLQSNVIDYHYTHSRLQF
jgi:hypothetical protein